MDDDAIVIAGNITIKHDDQMTDALSDYIRACLARAAEAERLASHETNPATKTELLELASSWRQCAASYEYVQKLENFMKQFKAPDKPMSAH